MSHYSTQAKEKKDALIKENYKLAEELKSKTNVFINEHGDLAKELLSRYGLNGALIMMTDKYVGCFKSRIDFTKMMMLKHYNVHQDIAIFIDYVSMFIAEYEQEYFMIETSKNAVHVFEQDLY